MHKAYFSCGTSHRNAFMGYQALSLIDVTFSRSISMAGMWGIRWREAGAGTEEAGQAQIRASEDGPGIPKVTIH